MQLLLFSCSFPDLNVHLQYKDQQLNAENFKSTLEFAVEAIRKKLFDYAALDKAAIAKIAANDSSKINTIDDLILHLKSVKPSALEEKLKPYCKEDRNPARIIEKRLPPLTDIAISCYLSMLFEKLFPAKAESKGSPEKKEFRFAANYQNWTAVRKVNLEIAERKEVLACMTACLETVSTKLLALHPEFQSKMDGFLSKYPERKSYGKMIPALEEAQKQSLFAENDPYLKKYSLYKVMAQFGYSPYLSSALLGGLYPELKIPKPRGRQKK